MGVIEARKIVVDGRCHATPPGVRLRNWVDDNTLRLKMGEDGHKRGGAPVIRTVVLHTTQGIPGGSRQEPFVMLPGLGPVGDSAERNARYWSGAGRGTEAGNGNGSSAGAHFLTDYDGEHIQTADAVREVAYHDGQNSGIGIEIVQGFKKGPLPGYPDGYAYVYEGQLDAVVQLLDLLTRLIPTIQRQFHMPYRRNKPVPCLAADETNVVGIHGHNDKTTNRGPGDPGGIDHKNRDSDFIRRKLKAAGYDVFDYAKREDLAVWKTRQETLNRVLGLALKADGVPGPMTVAAIKKAASLNLDGFTHPGAKHGLWISRPGDEAVPT